MVGESMVPEGYRIETGRLPIIHKRHVRCVRALSE